MLFSNLFRNSNVNHFPDSFAVDRESLYRLFLPTLKRQLGVGQTVVISSHFPDVFFHLQDLLGQWDIEYHVITRPLDRQWFRDNRDAGTDRPYLVLADFLIDTNFSDNETWHAPLALMLLDRHPRVEKDKGISGFANRFPGKSNVGYFLSFEDTLIVRSIDGRMLDLLRQMGADDQRLITSAMLSKRLKKMLNRLAEKFTDVDQDADSIDQWYLRNQR